MSAVASVERDLRAAVPAEIVAPSAAYLTDQTEARGLVGRADAVALPRNAEEVAQIVSWCYAHGVPIVPRGGGTGYAGGAVPLDGGVVISLERLDRVRSFDPLLWRIEVEAGVRTAELRRIAREGGLLFAPDPGAAEQSQIGGNVATNAGGPHAFKYGVTGAWVTGLEVVVPPGELVQLGGPLRKDVAGYDLKHLLIGSEGTLGVITAAWLRLTPAPEAAWPVIGFFDGVRGGVGAIERVVGSGLAAAALEYIDSETMRYAGASFPGEVVQLGGALRKDVAGYDLKHLLVGSEGTLGVITAAWLRLTPAPEAAWPVIGFFDGVRGGVGAIERVVGSGLTAAALEYIDSETMRYAGASFPGEVPGGAFAVLAEADGSTEDAARIRTDLLEVFGEDALALYAPESPEEIAALWRWRDGLALVVDAQRGGKASEDIAVPLDRLGEAIEASLEVGRSFGIPACSWGHAGDGNLHTTFLLAGDDDRELELAPKLSEALFELALRLGGTISGEHGVGFVKRNWLAKQLGPRAFELHGAVKRAFDPQNLLNPGKKA